MTVAGSVSTRVRLGRCELIRRIAQGGMADIYLARRSAGDRSPCHVAVKLLNPGRARDDEARAMFLDEARLLLLLHHPNIAAVLEVDVVGGLHYLAMEYVHGADLRTVVAAARRAGAGLPLATALAVVSAAAAGLSHAHRAQAPDGRPLELVHRDVSLSNLMVSHDGLVKVIDFGIASTAIASVHPAPGVIRGKPNYMSPEQCLGGRVDARCDVFSLGVVLYELTTGIRCFRGRTDFDRMLAVVRGDYLRPRAIVPGYPAGLEAVVRAALACDPARRFASADALGAALAHVAARAGWDTSCAEVQRTMHRLFGDVPVPWASRADDTRVTEPLITERAAPVPGGTDASTIALRPVRCADGEAAGTGASGADELDERTRGRRPLRRPRRAWLAA